jgi:hypothetical protein
MLGAVGLAAVAAIFVDNNVDCWNTPRDRFTAQLDRDTELGMEWVVSNQKWINIVSNDKLEYMIANMADLSSDSRPRALVNDYLTHETGQDFWRRMIDPTAKDRAAGDIQSWCDYCRWMAYSIAPDQVPLTPDELRNMLSPDKYVWGSRTHQLLSLILYRERGHNSPEVNRVINRVCEGVAREEEWDIRVSDLYLQRVAFLLAAGRPDLVKRRWIERILANQKEDGGWSPSWHGIGPNLFEFHYQVDQTTPHASVQGVWALYMIKYRYPQWIAQNYHAAGVRNLDARTSGGPSP